MIIPSYSNEGFNDFPTTRCAEGHEEHEVFPDNAGDIRFFCVSFVSFVVDEF